jgi:serralysin
MLVPIPCARHVGRLTGVVLLCLFAVAAPRAHAAFHLWQAKEIFTNSTGSVQFIELHDNFGGENSVTGFTLTSNSDGVIKTFTFPHDLVGDTTNHDMLIATTGFNLLPGGVFPNYTFTEGGAPVPFFNPNATNITISFSGSGDSITFPGASLSKNGINSLTDTNLYGPQSLVSGTNSPTNLAGSSGSVNLAPEPGTAAALLMLPLSSLLRRRKRN